jgi:predicted dinucleotide-binding enzyme
MNFGVIGPGDIGEVIIRKLRDAGYPVKMANSRGPESLKDLATKTGAIPASLEQVVQDVEAGTPVVNAVLQDVANKLAAVDSQKLKRALDAIQ